MGIEELFPETAGTCVICGRASTMLVDDLICGRKDERHRLALLGTGFLPLRET